MTKVALCLSGTIGSIGGPSEKGYKSDVRILMKAYEHYKRHIIDKNNVDIFIHCWDKDLEFDIKMLYKPVSYKIEKQIKFKFPRYVKGRGGRGQSHYSRWYSNMIVNDLRRKYEQVNKFTYDYVMTTRFDLAFETDLIFSKFDNNYFYAGKWSAVFDQNKNDLFLGGRGTLYDLVENNDPIIKKTLLKTLGYPSDDKGLLDLWFFSNSENSSKFYSLYKYLDEYNKPGNCPLSGNSFRSVISNHQLALYHLKQIDLLDKLRFEFHMYDDFPEVRRKYYKCRI
tara:strand:+ start:5802 stop:6647 length:846 start_codon:yes stop_codon:yes gene_type:complete